MNKKVLFIGLGGLVLCILVVVILLNVRGRKEVEENYEEYTSYMYTEPYIEETTTQDTKGTIVRDIIDDYTCDSTEDNSNVRAITDNPKINKVISEVMDEHNYQTYEIYEHSTDYQRASEVYVLRFDNDSFWCFFFEDDLAYAVEDTYGVYSEEVE